MQGFIEKIAEEDGGNYIEMLDVFRAYSAVHLKEKMYPRRDNMHMFKNGHKLVAEKLVEELS